MRAIAWVDLRMRSAMTHASVMPNATQT